MAFPHHHTQTPDIDGDFPDLTDRINRASGQKPWAQRLFDRLARVLPSLVVTADDGKTPYLTRLYLSPDRDWWRLRLGLPGVFLHWFHRSDADRELHCHPWRWSLSLGLWGGYEEERIEGAWFQVGRTYFENDRDWREETVREAAHRFGRVPRIVRRRIGPGRLNFLRDKTFHRVTLFDPRGCLTLFIAGPKSTALAGTTWGFLSRDGQTYETLGEREERVTRARASSGYDWCECSDRMSGGVPCPPGTCPNNLLLRAQREARLERPLIPRTDEGVHYVGAAYASGPGSFFATARNRHDDGRER
jgi:hypothetical protein